MKKLLATLTTVAMLATTTAFAAPIENNAGYNKTAGTYSVKSDLSAYEGQLTLLIIPEEAYFSTTGIEDADILYIDQTEAGTGIFQSVGILGGTTLGNGTYYAKIGGTGLDEIIVETFTIAAGELVQLGDTTGEGNVDGSDLNPILQHMLKATTLTGKTFFAADTTGEGSLDGSDLNPILQHMLKAATLGKAIYYGE